MTSKVIIRAVDRISWCQKTLPFFGYFHKELPKIGRYFNFEQLSESRFWACLDSDSDSSIFKISDSDSNSDSSKNSLIPLRIRFQSTFLDSDSDSSKKWIPIPESCVAVSDHLPHHCQLFSYSKLIAVHQGWSLVTPHLLMCKHSIDMK